MNRTSRFALCSATLVILVLTAPAVFAVTRTVPSAAYPTVQDAVNDAMTGDAILIQPGTYEENVVVSTDGIRFAGDCSDPRSVILDGGDSGIGLEINADDIEVFCLTLRHYSRGIDVGGYSGLVVSRTHFRNCDTGIAGDGDGAAVVSSVFFGCEDHSMDFDGEDVYVENCTSNNSGGYNIDGDRLEFRNNSVEQVYETNCLKYFGDDGRIERMFCDGSDDGSSSDGGIYVNGDDNVVRHNTVRNSDDEGIEVDGDDCIVEYNETTNSDNDGFAICGDRNTIRLNTSDGASDCFDIDGDDLLIEDNEATDCEENGFEIDGDKFVVRNNSVGETATSDGFDIDCYSGVSPYLCTWATVTGNTAKSTAAEEDAFNICGENMTIAGNRADNASDSGFDLSVDDSTIEWNRFAWTGSRHEPGMDISGDDNTIRSNNGDHNAGECIYVDGNDNLIRANTCRDGLEDGFYVTGADNRLAFNVAQRNEGEGIQNDGTDTKLFRNTARTNRIDCAGDDGTEALDSGNTCDDGTDFDTPDEINP